MSDEPLIRDKKKDQALVAWLDGEFKKAKDARNRDERQWFINLAMYFGKQNIQIIATPGAVQNYRLYTPPAPYYRARPIINRIRPLIRTEVSKLTSQKPSAFVVPASSEDRDLYAANAGEQIWDSLYHQKHLQKILYWLGLTHASITVTVSVFFNWLLSIPIAEVNCSLRFSVRAASRSILVPYVNSSFSMLWLTACITIG